MLRPRSQWSEPDATISGMLYRNGSCSQYVLRCWPFGEETRRALRDVANWAHSWEVCIIVMMALKRKYSMEKRSCGILTKIDTQRMPPRLRMPPVKRAFGSGPYRPTLQKLATRCFRTDLRPFSKMRIVGTARVAKLRLLE